MTDNRIRRGAQAARELELTDAAFTELEAEIVKAWIGSRDRDQREELHAKVCGLRMVRDRLNGIKLAGQVEAKLSAE